MMTQEFCFLCQEFELWTKGLSGDEKQDAAGFFSVIRRISDSHSNNISGSAGDLYNIPYSKEYSSFLTKASELLHKAGDLTSSPRYTASYVFSLIVSLVSTPGEH